jgi:uncharacterized protein (TIGR03663 family)
VKQALVALELRARAPYASTVSFLRHVAGRAGLGILLVAAVLRLWALDLRPPHFDEGVNGWFADQMTQTGFYRYDPTNYHGPLHFYAVFLSQSLFGRGEVALRLPSVLAGVLMVWALLRARVFLGGAACLAAAAAALSPGMIFHSRYSIHESWMGLFLVVTLLGVVGLWMKGDRRALWCLAAGLTGMVLTKETYVIHVAAFALAFPCLALWERVVPSQPGQPWARQSWSRRDLAMAAGVSAGVTVAFYSGFFMDFSALPGLYETFATWTKTGLDAAGHAKPEYALGPLNFYWLAVMAGNEPVGVAGFVACFALLGPSDARLRYVAIYGGGVLLAYSLIPYKTPWCVVAILPPFFLVAAGVLARVPRRLATAAWVVLLGASVVLAVRLNYFRYASDEEHYNYVQSYPELRTALEPLERRLAEDPGFLAAHGSVILDSYYPLPWLLGDFLSVGYYEEDQAPEQISEAFVLTSKEMAPTIESRFTMPYYRRAFRLRSGKDACVAYYRHPDFQTVLGGPPDVLPGATDGSPEPPTR